MNLLFASMGGAFNGWAMGILLLLYVAGITYLGFRGYRKTKSSSDYLVAGRSAHPFAMAMSYGAAFISTSALVGFGGIAGEFQQRQLEDLDGPRLALHLFSLAG